SRAVPATEKRSPRGDKMQRLVAISPRQGVLNRSEGTRTAKPITSEIRTTCAPSDDDATFAQVRPISGPCSAWTAKANKRVQFGYGLNYLIDIEYAVIVDVEAMPARAYDEVDAT